MLDAARRSHSTLSRDMNGEVVGEDRYQLFFFFSSRRRHTRLQGDWCSDVCSSDLSSTGDAITVTGTGGTVSVTAVINSIGSIACSPGTLTPSAASTCTVILSGSGGGTIGLSSNSTNLAVPTSLTIPTGSSSGTFL